LRPKQIVCVRDTKVRKNSGLAVNVEKVISVELLQKKRRYLAGLLLSEYSLLYNFM
jgi:hypothetical protein